MCLSPEHKLNIASEEDFPARMQEITRELTACRSCGHFMGSGGAKLFYEYFLSDGHAGSVVIVHGLSEFTKKYYEFAHCLWKQGYSVFLYDQRCHGLSQRLTTSPDLIHVERFETYAKDLDRFLRTVVLPVCPQPLYLYSHSMGGAVTARYLSDHPETVKKAVLSAPMIDPYATDLPRLVAATGLLFVSLIMGRKHKFFSAKEFNPYFSFDEAGDRSRARFDRNMQLRRENPQYRTTPTTMGWAFQALRVRGMLLRRAKKIKTPLLLLSAEKDRVVKTEAQKSFAEKCPDCRLVTVTGAGHPLLTDTADMVAAHIDAVLCFFSE